MKPHIFSLILLAGTLSSCELNQKDISPTDNFVKIYNHPDENLAFYAESVLQLADGYLILSGIKNYNDNLNEYPTTSLIRTNSLGEVSWSNESEWRAPVSNLLTFNGATGFVAMNASEDAYFVEVNTENGSLSSRALNLKMPLAAFVNSDGNLAILSYDYVSWSSVISLFSPSFTLLNSVNLFVGDDLVVPVQKHLNKADTQFPFFFGDWQNESLSGFFVNCLSNYTLGVRFFTSDGNSTGGWIYSHQIENAVSSLLHKEGNLYGMTRYFNRKNYLNSTVEVDVTSLQNFNDSTQNPIPEIVPDAKVEAIRATFDNTDYLLFASTTNSNSIVIFKYSLDNDELLKEVEVSFAYNIEVRAIIQDPSDEGIILLAHHFVTGRYLRPVLIKIPKRDF